MKKRKPYFKTGFCRMWRPEISDDPIAPLDQKNNPRCTKTETGLREKQLRSRCIPEGTGRRWISEGTSSLLLRFTRKKQPKMHKNRNRTKRKTTKKQMDSRRNR